MSLSDLTRSCYENSVAPNKWAALSSSYIACHYTNEPPETIGIIVTNSVLIVFPLYSGDPVLGAYLSAAIHAGILSYTTYLRTFLQALQSNELQNPSYWNVLCSTAVLHHRHLTTSGLVSQPPVGYAISEVFVSLHDALNLVNVIFMRMLSGKTPCLFELVKLLAADVDVSHLAQIPAVQVATTCNLVATLLQSGQDIGGLQQVLHDLHVDLRLVLDSNSGGINNTSMTLPINVHGQIDMAQPMPDSDLVLCGSLLRLLVEQRGTSSSCSSDGYIMHLLTALFRWTGWPLAVFYRQLLLSAITLLSEVITSSLDRHRSAQSLLWKSFVIGRLPGVLASSITVFGAPENDALTAIQGATQVVLQYSDLLNQCNYSVSTNGTITSDLDHFTRPFMVQLATHNLVDVSGWDPSLFTCDWAPVMQEAQTLGVDMNEFVGVKLASDMTLEELILLVNSAIRDYSSHAAFFGAILNRIRAFSETFDVEPLSRFSLALMNHPMALDIMAMHVRLDVLIDRVATGPQFDLNAVGDPQTTVSHVGNIILFVQSTIIRFKLHAPAIRQHMRAFDLTAGDLPRNRKELPQEDLPRFQAWFTTLFDEKSEGIEDSIFRSTRVLSLLRIAPALIMEAIAAVNTNSMTKDVLRNGVSYFLGPLLNWTLAGVMRTLINELRRTGFRSFAHLEVLNALFMADTTPQINLKICSPLLLQVLTEKHIKQHQALIAEGRSTIDPGALRQRALSILGIVPRVQSQVAGSGDANAATQSIVPATAPPEQISWVDQAPQAIRVAIALATSGRPFSLDVSRCLITCTPVRFLHYLWAELLRSAMMNGVPASQRIAVFILTVPQSRSISGSVIASTLLPMFAQVTIPRIISDIDNQASRDLPSDLLAAIISAGFTMAYYLAAESKTELPHILAFARELANTLQAIHAGSITSRGVLQRLANMPAFYAQFSMFAPV